MVWKLKILRGLIVLPLLVSACSPVQNSNAAALKKVIAVETFLADIARNVAGDRLQIDSIIPVGVDPHSFEPSPRDVAAMADSRLLLVNGAGYETWLQKSLANIGAQVEVVQASAGLTPRKQSPNEIVDPSRPVDPHFWLDPNNVMTYVANIRDAFSRIDPAGKEIYAQNAENYIAQLKDLDAWVKTQVSQIPAEKRVLVTNHESLGYFADRYGFSILGTVLPGTSSESSPSAQEMSDLIQRIRQSPVKLIFLELGANPALADQIAAETGARVVTNLYTESLSAPGGEAPTYIEMIRHDVGLFAGLK